MRALVIEHNEAELPGLIGQRAEEIGIELVPLVVSEGVAFPEPNEFDLIIPMGAPESVRDTSVEWIPRELDLLARAVAEEVPVFGICFGAQMLSCALGGEVYPADRPEVGWRSVASLDETLVTSPIWFELHFDGFTLPPGASELARNEAGLQGFTFGPHLGVQFHPEVTPQILQLWFRKWPAIFHDLGVSRKEMLEEADMRQPEIRVASYRLFDGWLERIQRGGGKDG